MQLILNRLALQFQTLHLHRSHDTEGPEQRLYDIANDKKSIIAMVYHTVQSSLNLVCILLVLQIKIS